MMPLALKFYDMAGVKSAYAVFSQAYMLRRGEGSLKNESKAVELLDLIIERAESNVY